MDFSTSRLSQYPAQEGLKHCILQPKAVSFNRLSQYPAQEGLKQIVLIVISGILTASKPISSTRRIETTHENFSLANPRLRLSQYPAQEGLKPNKGQVKSPEIKRV